MSTASLVPETHELDGDDAIETLKSASVMRVLKDALLRLRHADGFSYARSMAFQLVVTVIPGIIFVVALSVRLGEGRFRSILSSMFESLAPGPAGEIFRQAFSQGSDAASTGNLLAIGAGALAMIVSGVTGMAQLQRGASRIYGVLEDRSTLHRYGLSLLLMISSGALLTGAFVAIALGGTFGDTFDQGAAAIWSWLRWPLGLLAVAGGLDALFRAAPNRRQPSMSWLITGAAVAAVGWTAMSVLLSLYLSSSSTFGDTYGPLAGIIGLMLWAQLTAIAILYGLAVAAQLEAFRAGEPGPEVEHRPGDESRELVPG